MVIHSCGHQTIEKTKESISVRKKIGPIKSTSLFPNGTRKPKQPFAGDGYYFWEDNLDAADWWGITQYENRGKEYRIFKINFIFDYSNGTFLDLVGSRQHLKFIASLIEKTKKNIKCSDWKFHNFIEYFKFLASTNPQMFPYKMVRFNDASTKKEEQKPISLNDYNNKILMNPFFIVCVFKSEDLNLQSYEFIK